MSAEVETGVCATRGGLPPDFTFLWSADLQGNDLLVSCSFGTGTTTDNLAKAVIPVGSTAPVPLNASANGCQIGGNVQAYWSTSSAYVVVFYGAMVAPGVNNVFSSSGDGVASQSQPIIIAAQL